MVESLVDIDVYCFLSIIHHISDCSIVRNLLGLCEEFYKNKENVNFELVVSRFSGSKALLMNNPETPKTVQVIDNYRIIWNELGYSILDFAIDEGCWKFEGKFCVLCHPSLIGIVKIFENHPFGLVADDIFECSYCSSGMMYQNGKIKGNQPFKEQDVVSLELNMKSKELSFRVNGQIQPVHMSNIPSPLKIWFGSSKGTVFERILFRRMLSFSAEKEGYKNEWNYSLKKR